jgi:hypothetical protein
MTTGGVGGGPGPTSPFPPHQDGKFLGMNILGVLSEKFGKIFGTVLKIPSFKLDGQSKGVRVSREDLKNFVAKYNVSGHKQWSASVAKSPSYLKAFYTRSVAENFVTQEKVVTRIAPDEFTMNKSTFWQLQPIMEKAGFEWNKDVIDETLKTSESAGDSFHFTKDQLTLLFSPKYVAVTAEHETGKTTNYYRVTSAEVGNDGAITYGHAGEGVYKQLSKQERANAQVFGQDFWQDCVDTLIKNAAKGWQRAKVPSGLEQKSIIADRKS